MALEPTKETITSALGPKGPAIEDMALRLVAELEKSEDLYVVEHAYKLAEVIFDSRREQKRDHAPIARIKACS